MARSPFGFFETRADSRPKASARSGTQGSTFPIARLRQLGCRACPLSAADVLTPKMPPTGAERPLLYVLDEAPGQAEDETPDEDIPKFGGHHVRHLLGRAGQRLRAEIPTNLRKRIRWNSVIQDRPPKGRNPQPNEVACCAPRIEADLAQSKPRAVLALGPIAAAWFGATGGINGWRGRRFPFAIDGHAFWVYPVFHPGFVVRVEAAEERHRRGEKVPGSRSDADRLPLWFTDLGRVWDDLVDLPEPHVLQESDFLQEYQSFLGGGSAELARIRAALADLDQTCVTTDVETNQLRPYAEGAKLLSLAVSDGKRTVAIAVDHPGSTWKPRSLEKLKEIIRGFLKGCQRLVAHNARFEMEWYRWWLGGDESILFEIEWDCTQAQAYVIDGGKGMLKLDVRCLLYFGLRIKSLSEIDVKNLIRYPIDTVLRYNAIDAESTALLEVEQSSTLRTEGLYDLYRFHARRLPGLAVMQARGVSVDLRRARALCDDFAGKVAKAEEQVNRLPVVREYAKQHGRLNLNSPQQLCVIFRDMLERPEGKRGSKYSTDEAVLKAMSAAGVDLAKAILDHRGLVKLKGTYLDTLLPGSKKTILHPDGLLHASFSDTGTDTSRLAASDPNLQQYPKRDHREIRGVVHARRGRVFMATDYGQIEYRVIAEVSRDPTLIQSLHEHFDVHLEWSKRIAAEYPEILRRHDGNLKALRGVIKNLFVFPAFYLAGERTIARYLQMPQGVTSRIFKRFWKEFSAVKEWQLRTVAFYKEHGYVVNPLGRRRYAPLSMSAIVNTPIQSGAAEITNDALDRMAREAYETGNDNLQPRLQIHDDLTFEPEKAAFDATMERVVTAMLHPPHPTFAWLTVPLTVEVQVGRNWADLVDVGTFESGSNGGYVQLK